MLIIAIGHGRGCDPFTTSKVTRDDYCIPEPVNPNDAQACLAWICKEKNIESGLVDELLIVDLPDYDADPEVIHHFTFKEDKNG